MPISRGRPNRATLAQRDLADAHLDQVARDWQGWARFWATYPASTPREARIAREGAACYTALHRWQAERGQPLLEARAGWADTKAA